MAAMQREDLRDFLARKKGDYRSKFPFLTERQVVAKLKRIWSSQNASNGTGSHDKRNDVTLNRSRQTRLTGTASKHRPNKRNHNRQKFADELPSSPQGNKENVFSFDHDATHSTNLEVTHNLHNASSTSAVVDRTSCYDFPSTWSSPDPVVPPRRKPIVRPVWKQVSSDPASLSSPLSPSQSNKTASDLIGSLNDENRVGELSSNSQSGCVSRHSMRLRSSRNKPHPLGTSHSQRGNTAAGQLVEPRKVRFMGQEVLTFEPKLPVSSTTASVCNEILIELQPHSNSTPPAAGMATQPKNQLHSLSPAAGLESTVKDFPPGACQTEIQRSNSFPKGNPGSAHGVVPLVADVELNGFQGNGTSVASDVVTVDEGNVCILRNEHLNAFNQSSESNELEIPINKHDVEVPESQEGDNGGESAIERAKGKVRKTRRKRGGGKKGRSRTATRKRLAADPLNKDGELEIAKRPRLTPPSQEQEGTDTPLDEQDTPTVELQVVATTDDENQPADKKDETTAQDEVTSSESTQPSQTPNETPSLMSPVTVDPLCDMFLPLTPEREKYGFFKDTTSFYNNSISQRRVFRSSAATMATTGSAAIANTKSQENTYCMFDNEADIFM